MGDAQANTVLLFTRLPVPGQVKTRLIPALGAEGAAQVQREMTELIACCLRAGVARREFGVQVLHANGSRRLVRRWLGRAFAYQPQVTGDLGQRLTHAFERAFSLGARRVVAVGADCPAITLGLLQRAFAELESRPVVFGPAEDGGYYLIGLSRLCPALFEGIGWGGSRVLADSLLRAGFRGWEASLLPSLPDVDRPEDLAHWEALRRSAQSLAVILPTLNEGDQLPATLECIGAGQPDEIIVADGGSTDGTALLAKAWGARVVEAPRGRAAQMNGGAAVAGAELLLFLHADTWPPAGYVRQIRETLRSPAVAAGAFRFGLRESVPTRRVLESLVAARCRVLGTPFGDQGLFLRRDLFLALGGFAQWPLLEDVEILRRLRPWGRVVVRPEVAHTSARRWQRLGAFRTFLRNYLIMLGYHAGVSPARLAAWYHRAGEGDARAVSVPGVKPTRR